MARQSRFLRAVVGAVAVWAVIPPTAGAFTGTRAALALVTEMRSAYVRVPAVRWVLRGAVVDCPSVPFAWSYAPMRGCHQRATVTEVDDLRGGRVAVGVGSIAVNSRAKARYAYSPAGLYTQVVGTSCWRLRVPRLQSPRFISYPLPGERLAVVQHTRHEIVLQAQAGSYRELDFVDPRTFLERRQVDETLTPRRTYKAVFTIHELAAPVDPPSATPSCR